MGSKVRQCRQCGKLFQSLGSAICPECAEETDRCFKVVKNYLYDRPDANVFEISNETGVPEKMVLGFLKEGRLSVNASEDLLLCEKCGIPVSAGRFCSKCQSILESALNGACKHEQVKPQETRISRSSGKMHVDYHG
jgi:flagellar operon protein (TIGR03826 family)